MKARIFYLGLLSTLVMATTQTEGMQRMQNAGKMEQELTQHKVAAQQHLDLGGHANDPAAAAQGIADTLGEHPVALSRTGTTVNHKVTDLNTRLGTKTHAPTGPSTHEKLTDLLAIQGAITNRAVNGGANSGNVGLNANDLAGTAIKNEERILVRLKRALRANAGVALIATVSTKTAHTAAGNLVLGVNGDARDDDFNALAADNIEDFLAELGW